MRRSLYNQIKQRLLNKNLKLFAKQIRTNVVVELNRAANDNTSNSFYRELEVFKKYNQFSYTPPDKVSLEILETASKELFSFLETQINEAIKNDDQELMEFYNKLFFCVMGISFYTHCQAVTQTFKAEQ